MNLSVVIPAHNEEEGVRPTVERLYGALMDARIPFEILVVNDHSTDGTERVLSDLARALPGVRYVNNPKPGGFGRAIQTGLERFRGDAVCIVMADASDDPQDVITYYRTLEAGYECVFGSRFVRGSRVVDYPMHKLLINRLANAFINMLFRLHFNDTTNAFKAYRREVIEGVKPFLSSHFNITVELPLKAITRGYTYTTVPINWYNRATGVSKLKIKEMGSRYLFIVLYVWLEKWLSRGDYRRNRQQSGASDVSIAESARQAEALALAETQPRPVAQSALGTVNSHAAAATLSAVAMAESPAAPRAPIRPTAPPTPIRTTAPSAPTRRLSASWLMALVSVVMLMQLWLMYGSTVHADFVADDWDFLQGAATTPLPALLAPGGGYHYNPILWATIWTMYKLYGIHHVAAYHLFAYGIFWMTAVLAMLIARKLTGSAAAGALTGILFIGFGTQYEAAVWGVVAFGPAMSTLVYAAGLLGFMLAHDTWRPRWQRVLFYSLFALALILGPFIYEQDITLVAACLLYRVFVIDQDLWRNLFRSPRMIFARIPGYLADFTIPALFFAGYLAFKVILGRMYPGVPETPGLVAPLSALTFTATLGVFQAFFPGLTLSEMFKLTLVTVDARLHVYVLLGFVVLALLALVIIKPIYKFALLWAIMLICAQTLGLANISSRHLMLMTIPTAILWAGLLTGIPSVLARLSERLRGDGWFAWQAGYGASLLLLLLFLGMGYRYSVLMLSQWRSAVGTVDSVITQLSQYAAEDPQATTVYLVNLPDYTPATTGETMYEFRNSTISIIPLKLPGRFTSITGIRTSPDIIVDGTVTGTVAQIDEWAKSPTNLVVIYDLNSGQLLRWQSPRALTLYYNSHTRDHWVTTSTAPLASGYVRQSTLAYLSTVEEPETNPIYSCVTSSGDHFLSIAANCEGNTTLQLEGWLYNSTQANTPTVPLYRCRTSSDHFISTQSNCGGSGTAEVLLGYGGSSK